MGHPACDLVTDGPCGGRRSGGDAAGTSRRDGTHPCIEDREPTVSKATNTPQTRRARRAAEREAANSSPRRSASRAGRSPLLLITAIVGGVGVVVLAGLILLQGGSGATDATSALISPLAPTPVTLADGRSVGKADAPVTLEVWTDFQCPICGQFAKTVEPALMAKLRDPGRASDRPSRRRVPGCQEHVVVRRIGRSRGRCALCC